MRIQTLSWAQSPRAAMAVQGRPEYLTRVEAQQGYITRGVAQQEIARRVGEQASALMNQQQQIEILNRDARALVHKLANDADAAPKHNKSEAEKQIDTQVGRLLTAVTTVEGKLAEIESLISRQDDAQVVSAKGLE